MFSLLDPNFRPSDSLGRREFLTVGALGTLGLAKPQTAGAERPAKGKACIQLFLLGAPPQQESWDPKPDSPVESRGDLGVIRTATPGLIVGETMPKTARLTEKIAVLRAVQTSDNAHSASGYYMTTGVPHAPRNVENAKPGAPNDWPSLGAIVRRLRDRDGQLPSAITLPEQSANDGNLTWPGQDAGFLGRAYDPWLLTCEPESSKFQMTGLGLPDEVPPLRFDGRRSLLDQVNAHFDRLESGSTQVHQARTRQAYELISSPAARKAFDLNAEDPRLRDRYGRTRFGQSCLLARRLVESGASLVRVNWTRVLGAPNNGSWDTHQKNSESVRKLMPVLDQAYATLLEDLADRGLLESTMVVWTGEFGRTPTINGAGGRDHWGNVFSVALAGGGIRGGTVYGASDKLAAYPKDGRVTPPDVLATMLHGMGIAPDSEIRDGLGRPLPASRGDVIRAIL